MWSFWTQQGSVGFYSVSLTCSRPCLCLSVVFPVSIHSFHWHVQNVTIPCRSQELLPFLSVMYFFLPPFSTNCSSIFSHLILSSISWSNLNLIVPKFIYNTLLGILFSSILFTCPNQCHLFLTLLSLLE